MFKLNLRRALATGVVVTAAVQGSAPPDQHDVTAQAPASNQTTAPAASAYAPSPSIAPFGPSGPRPHPNMCATVPNVDPVSPTNIQQTAAASRGPARPTRPLTSWERRRLRWQEAFLGYPEEFEPAPLGYYVYQHGRTQVANGEAHRMALYGYDFVDGGAQLNERGKYQLAKIAAMLPQNFFPVVIEASPRHPSLDEARRAAVLSNLGQFDFPVPIERIVVARPTAIGLNGAEAELIYRNLLGQTQSRGMLLFSGGGVSGIVTGQDNSANATTPPVTPNQ